MKRNSIFQIAAFQIVLLFSAGLHANTAPQLVYPLPPLFDGPYWIDVVDYKGNEGISIANLNQRANAVGMLKFKASFGSFKPNNLVNAERCSGTLIANNLFLTAAHCLFSDGNAPWPKNANGSVLTPFESARLMEVRFNYKLGLNGAPLVSQDFKVSEVVDFYFGDLDYAVLKLEGTPGLTYGITPLSKQTPSSRQALFMIHHPEGEPQKISFGTSNGMQTVSEVMQLIRLVYDDVDTTYVSSGAGVLNSNGALVAIHNGGHYVNNMPHNYGTSIAQIIQDPDNTIIKNIVDSSSSSVPSGGKIFEYNDPATGNTPKTCSLTWAYGTGMGNTSYTKYKLTCAGDTLHVEVIKTYAPNNGASSCTFGALPSTGYRVSGSCTNWRVYKK